MKNLMKRLNDVLTFSTVLEKRTIKTGPYVGFTLQPLMTVFYKDTDQNDDNIATIARMGDDRKIKFFVIDENGKINAVYDNGALLIDNECDKPEVNKLVRTAYTESFDIKDSLAFEEAAKKALKIPVTQRAYSQKVIKLTQVVPGEKCNDGGEYGFYEQLVPTSIIGVFIASTYTTCEFDDLGTGDHGYVVLTKKQLSKKIEKSEEIERAGCQY